MGGAKLEPAWQHRPIRLFVYGTLMPGGSLWPVLAGYAVSWERVTARGRMWDTGHGYPAVRFEAACETVPGSIPGVLVTLDPSRATAAIQVLDRIEDVGRLYRRVEVTTSVGQALAYEWLGAVDGLAALPDGWPTPR